MTTTNPKTTPINGVTGRAYTGQIAEELQYASTKLGFASNHWATLNQWSKKGRSIGKGEIGTCITFKRKAENDDGEIVETTTTAYVYNRSQLQKLD